MILDKVEGDYRIRVGMMTPEEAMRILPDLLRVYKDQRVFKFFHIPVQSGSNRVLKIMGRRYTIEEFQELHRHVKNLYPDSLFATDIIVGHPGETEDDFLDTVRLVENLRFERVHLAQYSLRPHTRAAAMRQIPDPIKKERSTRLMRLIEKIGSEIYGRYVGKTFRVLLTNSSFRGDSITGRLDNYFPVIVRGASLAGSRWALVKVEKASFFDLRGVLVKYEG
jgi:threonylcarbamoyladenosine tRNA methylthiotransferase CDKAL1